MIEQLTRSGVGPVNVFEDQQEALVLGSRSQQPHNRLEEA